MPISPNMKRRQVVLIPVTWILKNRRGHWHAEISPPPQRICIASNCEMEDVEDYSYGRRPGCNPSRIGSNLPVMNGQQLVLSPGRHNVLQKAVVQEFLPSFGCGCEVLYLGDTSNKSLHLHHDKLRALGFFELAHEKLPDVVAYCKTKNWLFLFEAVHSSGTMSVTRVTTLKQMLKKCHADLIFGVQPQY